MRSRNALIAIAISILVAISSTAFAAVKPGSACSKLGSTSVLKGIKYTCVKSGKKLVWNKGSLIPVPKVTPTATPTPTPTPSASPSPAPSPSPSVTPTPTPTTNAEPVLLPTSFEDLFVRRAGIHLAAWQKGAEIIKANKSNVGTLEIVTGPNTKPYFDDYPLAIGNVSRLFPGRSEPTKTYVIRFKYVDADWAEATLKSKLGINDFNWLNNNEGGKVILGRCDVARKNCNGAMQQTIFSTGLSVIVQGVTNSDDPNDATGKLRFYSGMLEAHEYFHSLQRLPIMGKTNVWPHAWFREGSAEWVQNMAIFYQDFKTYVSYIKDDCYYDCPNLSESDIIEFLETSKENYFLPKFQQFLNYSLGSRFIETLVALKGPDTLIDMYAQMGKQLTFEQAFKNVYGVEWSYALPILAKTTYANLKEGR